MVDAYLTPVLAAYVARLETAVAGAPLHFMTSAGALARAGAFRGRDALVSGPAGGVVGVAGVAGDRAVLGFDMGGTSTDVCRYAGALERRDVAHVAGVKVRAPMLDVETVAAGGRLDPGVRRPARPGRPGQRRRRSRPGLLRPRRAGDGDRRQPGAGPARPGGVPERVRAGRRRAAGRRRGARQAGRAGGGDGRGQRRGRGRGVPGGRGRADGGRDPAHLDRARVRSARPRAGGVRRRGRPGRLPGGRGAGDRRGALAPLRQRALGLGHRPGADAGGAGGGVGTRAGRRGTGVRRRHWRSGWIATRRAAWRSRARPPQSANAGSI